MSTLLRRAALLLALLAAGAQAQPAIPPLTGRVVDRAGILAPETERALDEQLAAHEAATTNQVVVLTVPSLEGTSVEEAALRVFNAWGLGQAERDNGVLVLIARDDRELRIEVGYGLEGDLPDALAGRIIRHEFVPAFRDGDYDAGTLAGVSAIVGAIEGSYVPPEDDAADDFPWFARVLFALTHLLLPMVIAARGLFSGGCGRYFLLLFCSVFIAFGSFVVLPQPYGVFVGAGFFVLYLIADVYMMTSPKWRAVREQVAAATKSGKKTRVSVGGFSFSVGGASSSSGGGGGFSGGGGSSGGGGASGSW